MSSVAWQPSDPLWLRRTVAEPGTETVTREQAPDSGTHEAPLDFCGADNGEAVVIRGVGKRFGETPVLQGIDLSISPGAFVAIVGRSGCGKSTLLRLLAGLAEPNEGQVLVGGAPVQGFRPATRIMFQDARLLPWRRVLQNVGLGLRGDWKPIAAAALAQVGLGDRGGDWPSVLSGGQRQRVALARALVGRPRLLLLDEPLGALDALTRIEMQGLIEGLWREQGFTAVLVTHDVAEAVTLADRVVMIDHGRIVLDQAITLPRPRRRSAAVFAELEGAILSRLLDRPGGPAAFV
ncbi:MAG: ATP-binding cassette domain-containing protein [Azospirillaceae bacterium]|nr:ATP-binding cassette domain-containing protein [Azospirillaceae bacterium]